MAHQIARRAQQQGVSQLARARHLGIPQPTLSKIVNGRVSDLSLELLIRSAVRAGLPMTLQTGGQTLQIVGREDFVAMKCFAGGPQALLDARSAYRGAQGPVDLDLLRAVTRRFGRDAADRLEQVLAG